MKTSVVGYPRIGALRELKFWTESYFTGGLSEAALLENAQGLCLAQWKEQAAAGVDFIPSNDFSFYDQMLDTAALFSVVPKRYGELALSPLGVYFAMARGYQGQAGDVKALSMRKWFNTNYHYMAPEFDADTKISLNASGPLEAFSRAKAAGILTKPVLIGPYTFLKLSRFKDGVKPADFAKELGAAYGALLAALALAGAHWVQFDEPALVLDTSESELALFSALYQGILAQKGGASVLLQTYFGDLRDCFQAVSALPFDGIGLDFVEGLEENKALLAKGFPAEMLLFAGIVNGKNIWACDYEKALETLGGLGVPSDRLVISTGCSLLHVPYTLENEPQLEKAQRRHLAFAREKLAELADLKALSALAAPAESGLYKANAALFAVPDREKDATLAATIAALSDGDFTRLPARALRADIQKEALGLPLLPTTTIGSFPQTDEVKQNRARFKRGEVSAEAYEEFNRRQIADCIALQEELGLDVLVHGEFERNDMVEYFGENLDGFLFMKNAWVQSYGTRCVKPPVIWGDVTRKKPMTVGWSVFAQSCTEKPIKGMLTGPVTILNWSFPREDITLAEMAFQIALAIRQEVLDLEESGIRVIQVDEAALKEKLPLRKADWAAKYLDWAIPAFRLVHSGVKPETQVHTHMCYSEFGPIIGAIDQMDADVISFEASRSDLAIVDVIEKTGFQTAVGPGVYDIHSPRVPSQDEIASALTAMLSKIPAQKLWVNPDCGLKTRGLDETKASLAHLVAAAKAVRARI